MLHKAKLKIRDLPLGDRGVRRLVPLLLQLRAPLRALQLSGLDFTDAGARRLSRVLPCLTALVSVRLSRLPRVTPHGLHRLLAALAALPSLDSLALCALPALSEAFSTKYFISPGFPSFGALRCLDLSCCALRDVPPLPPLRSLALAGNPLRARALSCVASAAPAALSLAACGLKGKEQALAGALGGVHLQALDLRGNALGAGVAALRTLRCHRVQALLLGGNALGAEALAALAPVLARCRALERLDLGGDAHAGRAGHPRGGWGSFIELEHVHKGGDDADGGSAIGAALARALAAPAPRLRRLAVHAHVLGADGARALVPVLEKMHALEALHCDGCALGAWGAAALGAAVRALPALRALTATRNGIPADVAEALLRGAPPLLQLLDVRKGAVDAAGRGRLREAVRGIERRARPMYRMMSLWNRSYFNRFNVPDWMVQLVITLAYSTRVGLIRKFTFKF